MKPCKSCGGLVAWVRIQGRLHCHNADGSDHWDTCSKRKWQQVVATGEQFATSSAYERVEGYANSIHGTKKSRHAYAPVGDVKLSADCRNCVPPWDVCAACPDRL